MDKKYKYSCQIGSTFKCPKGVLVVKSQKYFYPFIRTGTELNDLELRCQTTYGWFKFKPPFEV